MNVFWNNGYEDITSVYDVTDKISSRESSFTVDKIMWPKFGNCSISMREVIVTQFCKDLTRKRVSFKGWSRFRFNNFGLALNIALQFYTSLAKG